MLTTDDTSYPHRTSDLKNQRSDQRIKQNKVTLPTNLNLLIYGRMKFEPDRHYHKTDQSVFLNQIFTV